MKTDGENWVFALERRDGTHAGVVGGGGRVPAETILAGAARPAVPYTVSSSTHTLD